mgnify:CR=1 FL=1|tara:strand:+ start:297 stop:1337 length:1041 start_codon:yes stop_codon:yes gene_type:complete
MKQHEREFFVYRIRSGKHFIDCQNFKLKVVTPTIDEQFEAEDLYVRSLSKSLADGIKTSDQMVEWMMERDLWTEEDEEKLSGLKKDVEKLKIEIYNHRNQEGPREKIRQYLRAGEQQIGEHASKKFSHQDITCEGIAFLEKALFLIKGCTFLGSDSYDFSHISTRDVWLRYQNLVCSESTIRELAREDPWRSFWMLKDCNTFNLFANKDRELSTDQKNLLAWSRMYDNIYESPDAPGEDVINDDDILDGWTITQKKKRERERAQAELESRMSDKAQGAGEIFLMAGSNNDAERIESMNDINATMTKKERLHTIRKSDGPLNQQDFPDEQLKMRNQLNQQYKDKFRR